MEFIHSKRHLNAGDIVELTADVQCNFMLTTDTEFRNFKEGKSFRYHGGFFKAFPAKILVPHSGLWNITIDVGDRTAVIRHQIRIIPIR
ncbi:MAG: DUF1883 domain-containing protein [Bacteroidetes bacterium]|nr:DUF1883 domain-containing protein [Bacteroidota bacterium]